MSISKKKSLFRLIPGVALLLGLCIDADICAYASNQDFSGYAQVYDVTSEEFGADGTDNLSDAQAIQNALDMAWRTDIESGKQICVYLPAGTYYIDQGLAIFSHTALIMDSNAKIVRTDPSNVMLFTGHRVYDSWCNGGSSCTHGGYTKLSDVTVSGGVWDGNINAQNSHVADRSIITFNHAADIALTNTTVTNGCGMHLVVLDGVKNVTVENVTFSNAILYTGKDDPLYFDGKDDSIYDKIPSFTDDDWRGILQTKEALHLDITNIVGNISYPLDDTPCANVSIKNCTFTNVFTGIGNHHEGIVSETGITIENNTFSNIKYNAVNAHNFKDFRMSGNTVDNTGLYLWTVASSGVSSNTTATGLNYVVFCDERSEFSFQNDTFTIRDQMSTDNYAVYVRNNSTCDMSHVTVSNFQNGGITVDSQGSLNASDVNLKGRGRSGGVIVKNGKVSISGGSIEAVGDTAAVTFSYESSGSISGCDIKNSTNIGILTDRASDVNICDNVLNNHKRAIALTNESSLISVQRNEISDCSEHGIYVNCKSADILDNSVCDTGDKYDGIRIVNASDAFKIKGNTVENVYNGITIGASNKTTIESNTIKKADKFGISVNLSENKSCSGVTVKSNTVTDCKEAGINVHKADNISVLNNTVTNTESGYDIGFWECVSGKCDGNTVTQEVRSNIQQTKPAVVTLGTNYVKAGKDGWVSKDQRWYYYVNGVRQTGWYKVSGKWYYFSDSGVMQTGWREISGKWYYLNPSGVMQTGWLKYKNRWYYMSGSGVMQTGWQKISGKWYYLGGNGIMQTGWIEYKNKWYYLSDDGIMQTEWLKYKNKWYYLGGDGIMQTGWIKYNNKWYYLRDSGVMHTGWLQLGSKWYYMNSSGVMQTGTQTINGKKYVFDANGVWMK